MPIIFGTIRNLDGTPYAGAIVEVTASNQVINNKSLIGNEPITTFSDSYGRFYVKLEPSKESTHYRFKITKDTVNEYLRVVPEGSGEINFSDLEVFIPPSAGTVFIGNC